jgi:uncharacterized protein DUF4406
VADRMPVVYVAGPFRAATAWKRHRNILEAEALAFRVAELGAMPLCPHTNTANFDGELTDGFWLAGTLELLRRCDAAVFTDRWDESRGAIAERHFCKETRIEIFEALHLHPENGALERWVRQWKVRTNA